MNRSPSQLRLYLQTILFGLVVFSLVYGYMSWVASPNLLNKGMADTAVILMGCSMLLSSVAYFWNRLDTLIVYRRQLGLIGFAFAVTHLVLSWDRVVPLLTLSAWSATNIWPVLTGAVAVFIFTVMALISNSASARLLGGKNWKMILRLGYWALVLVLIHIILLKSARWMTWYSEGMQTPPSLNLLTTGFIVLVLVSRVWLWISLNRAASKA